MEKKQKKRSFVPIIIIVVLLAAGGFFAYKYFTLPPVERTPLKALLEDKSDLATQTLTVSDCFEEKKGKIPLINKKKYLVKYIATVDAGFDIKDVDIDETDTKVVVTIPHCQVYKDSVNVRGEDIKTYDTNLAIFNPSADAIFDLEKEAEKKALKYAKSKESGLLPAADENAIKLMEGLVTGAADGRKVIIQFEPENEEQ